MSVELLVMNEERSQKTQKSIDFFANPEGRHAQKASDIWGI